MLSEAEVSHYHEKGYVFPDYRLPPETLQAIFAERGVRLDQPPQVRLRKVYQERLSL